MYSSCTQDVVSWTFCLFVHFGLLCYTVLLLIWFCIFYRSVLHDYLAYIVVYLSIYSYSWMFMYTGFVIKKFCVFLPAFPFPSLPIYAPALLPVFPSSQSALCLFSCFITSLPSPEDLPICTTFPSLVQLYFSPAFHFSLCWIPLFCPYPFD